ncbi:MAG: HAD-IB family hydrolase [bacterium]
MKASKSIAVFDLDGTITSKDTYLEFIKYSRGIPRYLIGLLYLSPVIIKFYSKRITNSVLKEKFFTYFFKNQELAKVLADGTNYSVNEIPKICRPAALKVLEWHKLQGHHILILSASAKLWLSDWCKLNDYELMCTEFEIDNNKFTGKLKGKNCFGEEKKIRLRKYLKGYDFNYLYCYGDSSADKPFLELADESYLMELNNKNVQNKWANHHRKLSI